MNETIKTLKSHRSIRKYLSDPIPETVLNEILSAGLRGSSSGNMNTWSVVVTSDKNLKDKLYELHMEQAMILEAPLVLTFCADFRRTRRWVALRKAKDSFDDLGGYLVAAIDAVIAAQNVVTAAESLGFGICYMGSTLFAATGIAELLKLPESVIPVTSIVLGKPAENPEPRHRLDLQKIVHRETYQDPTDEELLETYREREKIGWDRYRSVPAIWEEIQRLGINNLAEYYTSEAKYSKDLHGKISREYLALLKKQGFWNF